MWDSTKTKIKQASPGLSTDAQNILFNYCTFNEYSFL